MLGLKPRVDIGTLSMWFDYFYIYVFIDEAHKNFFNAKSFCFYKCFGLVMCSLV